MELSSVVSFSLMAGNDIFLDFGFFLKLVDFVL